MKFTLKIFLVICLFSSIALADGDQGSGGFTEGEMGNGKTCAPQQTCLEGDQGSGGRTVNAQNESVLSFIQKYLMSIFE